jgi:G3E family GTPase
MTAQGAIPVVVLTGFLGSGKTTILGHLLRQPEFSRTAVIINEFGEIGLDHHLVEASEDSLIELTTGCLCCKVRTDLAETLQDLLRRRDEGRCSPFDRIVIETSGLADPAPILQTLMTDAVLATRLVLGGVATTVDAVTGDNTLAREDVSQKQVAVAERIVLTKLDLASASEPALRARLRLLNSGAPIVTADHGRIAEHDLFATGLYDATTKSIDVQGWLSNGAWLSDGGWLADGAQGHSHSHDTDIESCAIVLGRPIRAVVLTLFLEALAEHCGADLLRLKGIVDIAESPDRPVVIHGVQHIFHAPAWLERWPSDDRRSRLVVIGRRIRASWVKALLAAIESEVERVARTVENEADVK